MPPPSVLIYLMRRDLRVADNPVFYALATKKDHGFTHLLPLYILAASHIEVSGFLPEDIKSPYPEARSRIAGFWRCGPHRAKFLGECLWDLKTRLEDIGSGLCIRVGGVGEVVKGLLVSEELHVSGVWMTGEEGVDESREENEVKQACEEKDVEFQRWEDEKYFIDDRDLPFSDPSALPDVFTSYRKIVEPLRDAPRTVLPTPTKGSLPPFPSSIPPQHTPFTIPEARDSLLNCLLSPLNKQELINNVPAPQEDFRSAHPFIGGESHAQDRLNHLISSGSMTTYKETRNGLLGIDFSTKLSGFLALGCITARQIHASLLAFEDASDSCPEAWKSAQGFGEGENEGTKGVRFELLWRDYMRLCTRKFGLKLFKLEGFNGTADKNDRWHSPESKKEVVNRFLSGTTGMGFIDASQREIFYTGYTSNRARQNVASFLSKILKIDWRVGAEWYECMLIDYDLSSNWGNWQYVAGVGNDPRGENGRVFNPVKQAFDYDPEAKYVKAWVRELKDVTDPGEAFQAWTISEEKKVELGLNGLPMVKDPLNKINFTVGKRESSGRGAKGAGRGRFRGNSSGGGEKAGNNENNPNRISPGARPGGYRGRGYGSSRPGGGYGGRGYGGGGRGRGGGHGTGNGNYGRVGMVDQDTNIAQQQQQTTPSRDQNH